MSQENAMTSGSGRVASPVSKYIGVFLIILSFIVNGLMIGLIGMKAQHEYLYVAGYMLGALFGQFAVIALAFTVGEVWAKKRKTARPGYLYFGCVMLLMAAISFMMQYQRWS